MTEVAFRRARDGDAGQAGALAVRAGFASYGETALRARLRSPKLGAFYVAEAGGALVGWTLFEGVPPEAERHLVVVAPAFRLRGVGRGLIAAGHAGLRSLGVTTVFLEVASGNRGAVQLYRRMAYRPVGLRRKYYPDGQDALILACALGDRSGRDASSAAARTS